MSSSAARSWHRQLTILLATAALVGTGTTACAGAHGGARRIDEATSMRAALANQDVLALAPRAFAEAEGELHKANAARTAGDAETAELHADRALATFNQAVAIARLARASAEESAANQTLATAAEQARTYATQRQAMDREADDLEKKLRVAREALVPPSSGPADPERETARVIAARALLTQARLLCSAARLVSGLAPGLEGAEAVAKQLETESDASGKLGIDPAARARAACLASLTKARRSSQGTDAADTLLGELSAQGGRGLKGSSDFAPARDERGVVLTLRSIFKGDKLTPEAESAVKELGRVAAAHPAFAIQIVLHDAETRGDAAANQRRGETLTQALVAGGLATSKVKVELAGARAPVVDPKDAKDRERNARVEIVFVSPG